MKPDLYFIRAAKASSVNRAALRTGPNEYAIIVNSDLTEHTARFIGTPDQLMQLAGQITTIARSIKAKEFSS